MSDEAAGYGHFSGPSLARAVVAHPAGALAAHWLFQGILAMDQTERIFKVATNALAGALCFGLLRRSLAPRAAIIPAALAGQTLGWLLNGQVWGVLKHFGWVANSRADFDKAVSELAARIEREPSIVYAAAYGSVARGAWKPSSDLDVRLVRRPGATSALRACAFAAAARCRAFFGRFPLDILVLDSAEGLARMREQAPIVLVDQLRGEVTL